MNLASQVAYNLRCEHPVLSTTSLINLLLTENKISVDFWPVGTEKFSGCLWENNGIWTIVINAKQKPQRKMFTIAHELGHFYLHRHLKNKFICFNSKIQQAPYPEQEANQFAVELLMPVQLIRQYLNYNFSSARTAQFLGVSEKALHYRLQSLKNTGYIF